MANEIPPNKGEQVKGGPPTVDNTQLPPMAKQARPPKLMHGAVRQMTVGAVPVHGSHLLAPVPQDHLPKPRAGGKPTSPAREPESITYKQRILRCPGTDSAQREYRRHLRNRPRLYARWPALLDGAVGDG